MKKEKSCGAVVYKWEKNQLFILLIKALNGHHYSFPKGHVEGNETEIETALREIKEETNLNVKVDTSFRSMVTYSPIPHVMKDVIYFVATPFDINQEVIPQKEELELAKWLPYEEAIEMTTFQDERNTLIKACEYIKTNCGIN